MPMKPENRLILALDVTDRQNALKVMDTVMGHIDAVKINYPLVLACGPGIVNTLSRLMPVICDFKLADIPNTCRLISENAFERGASGIIAHAFSGIDSLRAIKKVADADRYQKLTVAKGEAEAIETVFGAIHQGKPTNDLIAIKYLEALQKIADGQATKIFLPFESSGILGSIAGIGELFKENISSKKEK